MRRLYRETTETQVVSLQNRVDALERRFPNPRVCCEMPHVRCTGSTFTANDGSYYGLAQLVGADPSAFGVASQIVVWDDPGDGSGYFYIKTDGGSSPGVVQTYSGPASDGFGDQTLLMGYEAGVKFSGTLSGAGKAQLYLGQGVGGSAVSQHVTYSDATFLSYSSPVLRLSGELSFTFSAFDPATVNISPRWSPILLVEGANWAVNSTWFDWTVLSALDDDTSNSWP
jgi:hypothetical protein